MSHALTPDEMAAYQADGYLLLRGLFSPEEIRRLLEFARGDESLRAGAYDRLDASGNRTRLSLWNHPGDDLYSLFSRSPRLVDRAEQLLGGEVYHWHTKMMLKEPRVGGAWEWHQDYGYWYHNACLYPLLVSCLIAVDRATRDNGCLQVLRGSHAIGRIDHQSTGEQKGADSARVEEALKRHERVYVEASPGDVLFFDCNLLHRSDANRSEHPRWSLIACYNAARNSPYAETRHPGYSPLVRVADDAILKWGEAVDIQARS